MHKRIHTGEKPLQCPICKEWFRESSNLSKHKKTHNQFGEFVCPFDGCGKDFKRKEQLQRHIEKIHRSPSKKGGSSLKQPVEVRKTFAGVKKAGR
jgi:uncharacterized Zn-finger protein